MAELIITEPEDPWYISELENQKILFDVNSLLIGILFECSHSANIIRYVHELKNTRIVICPHIYDTAVQILKNKMPAAVTDFKSKLKLLIAEGMVISVDNGDISKLPAGLSFDPSDDDIVMATGLSEGCSKIVTLDTELALKITDHIEVLSPDDQSNSVLRSVMGIEDVAFYNSPHEGSITVGVQPQINSTNYKKSKGRRYVFCTDLGFSCWLNERTWKYQIGYSDNNHPIHTFPYLEPNAPMLISISYDCNKSYICFGIGYGYTGNQEFFMSEKFNFNQANLVDQNIGILNNINGNDSFNGFFQSYMTSKYHVGIKILEHALKTGEYYIPFDAQNYQLTDENYQRAIGLE